MNLHNFVELCMCPAPLGNEHTAKQLIRSMLPNGLEIYRSAVSYLIGIYVQVWEELAEIPDAKRRFNAELKFFESLPISR